MSHSDLKDEVKELCRRCSSSDPLPTFKSLLLDFPPLHNLNDILDEMSTTPNTKMTRRPVTPFNASNPRSTPLAKKRASASSIGCATKSLKFSPHLFKTEPVDWDIKPTSPKTALDLAADDKYSKFADDDDIIEIDGL